MNSRKWFSILTFLLVGSSSISISPAFVQHENFVLSTAFASSPSSSPSSSSNATNIVDEGNSTYSNSTQGNDLGVSKVIVIPNPNPAASGSENSASDSNNNTESDVLTSNITNTRSPQNNESSLESQDTLNTQQPFSNNSSMQRGEYKVDNNGIHYYNINNCSLVKGSSGIGDLSECEDAEREIQEELTG